MTIRKTELSDLPVLEQIFAHARTYMCQTGNPNQWGTSKPKREVVISDIENANSYVVEENGQICGTFAFFTTPDPTYAVIEDGAWLNDEPYGVIHRIASAGTYHGILEAAMEYCAAQVSNLRIDTHHDNHIMQHLLEKKGFKRCGIIHLEDGAPRIAYQRIDSIA